MTDHVWILKFKKHAISEPDIEGAFFDVESAEELIPDRFRLVSEIPEDGETQVYIYKRDPESGRMFRLERQEILDSDE